MSPYGIRGLAAFHSLPQTDVLHRERSMNSERNHRNLHLPVLTRRTQVKAPRVAHIRAVALIAVQLLMVVHVLCWAMTGKSIGRFVLSDSMKTFELGEINPGCLLFAGSLVLTALFGRLMCGWICHMGALQDFASWHAHPSPSHWQARRTCSSTRRDRCDLLAMDHSRSCHPRRFS